MSVDRIPIRDAAARRLAELDMQALDAAEPPGFRLERTQLRFEGALKNGLSQREAERLRELALLTPPTQRWRAWTAWLGAIPRTRLAIGVLAAAATVATLLFWLVPTNEPMSGRWLVAEESARRHVLEDGSSIVLMPNSQGRLTTSDDTVLFALDQGVAEFDVVAQDDGLWRVTAADYEVTVVGTRFTVSYDMASAFAVHVHQGVVAVRLPKADSVVRLGAGENLQAKEGQLELVLSNADAESDSNDVAELSPVNSQQHEAVETTGAFGGRAEDASATLAIAPVPAVKTENRSQRSATSANERASEARAPSKEDPHAAELRLLERARKAIAAEDYSSALNWVSAHKRRFSQGQLAEEREALRVEALRRLGREQEANRAAGEFREQFPRSVLTPQMPAETP